MCLPIHILPELVMHNYLALELDWLERLAPKHTDSSHHHCSLQKQQDRKHQLNDLENKEVFPPLRWFHLLSMTLSHETNTIGHVAPCHHQVHYVFPEHALKKQ